DGIFQKIARDISITSIFEGTQLVQLALIESQLSRPGARDPEHVDLDRLCDLSTPAPAWDPTSTGLRVAAPGGDELVERWFGPQPAADARRHSVLHAAACCRQMWLTNRDRVGDEWLEMCLDRLAGGSDWMPGGADLSGPMFDRMLGQHGRNELFSLFPMELA
ncbi:MAG TPA: hypothetical protein VHO95_01205, partial [Candidatus Dormibacteraeota bacterium]|nr:hypothetical protein [Candidatus Dormibacteraeota bacterium]